MKKEEVIAESPLKIDMKNSLKNIILKNLSEERKGTIILRKNSTKLNSKSDDKRIRNFNNRSSSQNSKSSRKRNKNILFNENNLDKINGNNSSGFRRKIIFNSFSENYFFPILTKNKISEYMNFTSKENNSNTGSYNNKANFENIYKVENKDKNYIKKKYNNYINKNKNKDISNYSNSNKDSYQNDTNEISLTIKNKDLNNKCKKIFFE